MLRKLLEGHNSYVEAGEEGFDEDDWEYLCEHLTDLMVGGTAWRVEVTGFGWQKIDGTLMIEAATGEELLRKVLPDTECHFFIYDDGNETPLKLNNFHHDSCTGDEWYTFHMIEEAE